MKLLNLSDLMGKVGLSKSPIYKLIRRSEFPAPIHLTDRRVAWVEAEVDEWIADRIAARGGVK